MSRIIQLFVVALVLSLAAVCWKARGGLQAARQELSAVTAANQFLRKTLGDMTVAMASKEREIDRLEHAGCAGHPQTAPTAPVRPIRRAKLDYGEGSRSTYK